MGAGVVLDTSYLITLADRNRDHHEIARRYWQHFMEEGIPVFLPTIVVSEFYLRQQIPPEILRCCVILPFNWDDATLSAQLDFTQFTGDGAPRVAVKDDIKIIAQAVACDALCAISEDAATLLRYVDKLKTSNIITIRPISLHDPFDRSHFDTNGQRDFMDTMEPPQEANGAIAVHT